MLGATQVSLVVVTAVHGVGSVADACDQKLNRQVLRCRIRRSRCHRAVENYQRSPHQIKECSAVGCFMQSAPTST